MYFWNINALARQLAADGVSEITGMYYFLLSSLLILLATYYALWWGVMRNWLFYFELLVLVIITIFGCYKSFEANGGNEGRSFVLKAVCLSVPAGVRVNVYSISLGLALYFSYGNLISYTAFADPYRVFSLLTYAGFVGFSIYFWWLLIGGLRKTRALEEST